MKDNFKKPNIDFKVFKDFKVRISQIPPLDVAFNTMALSDYELLVATIYRLNELIENTNSYTELINEIMVWVVNDGLDQAVKEQLNVWLNDGTLETLINDTLFTSKLDKTDFNDFVSDVYDVFVDDVTTQLAQKARQDVLNDISANVKAFGVKGDGVTDDSLAIQSVIDLGYKNIFFPKGNYLIKTSIKLPSNITLLGGDATLISHINEPLGNGSYSQRIFENNNMLNGNENIKIFNLIFDGNRDSATQGQGPYNHADNLIKLKNVKHLKIEDCVFKNHTSNWGETGVLDGDSFTAIHISESEDIDFINNESYNHRTEGLSFTWCKDLFIDRLYSYNEAVWTGLHAFYCDGVTITNSYIEENNFTGSTVNLTASNLLVDNCKLIGGAGVDIGNETEVDFPQKNITIQNCYIKTGLHAIYGMPSPVKENVKIINNYCSSISVGVRIGDCKNALIEGNTIIIDEETANSSGIQNTEYTESLTIRNNYIKATKGVTVYPTLETQAVKGLVIEDNEICIYPIGSNNSYRNYAGIFMEKRSNYSDHIIENIKIKNNNIFSEGSFVYILDESTSKSNTNRKNLFIEDNLFYSSSSRALRTIGIDSFRNVILKNNIILDGSTTIMTGCANIEIKDNKIEFPLSNNMSSQAFRIESVTEGKIIIENNYCSLSTNNLVRGDVNNVFGKYIIRNNVPNTYTGMKNSQYGTTENRPTFKEIGDVFLDTTLNKLIVWNGTNWLDGTGAIV